MIKLLLIIIGIALLITAVVFGYKTLQSKRQVQPELTYTSVQGKLVAGYPDFPVFAGAQVRESRTQTHIETNKQGYSASWELTGTHSVSEVMSWYKDELQKSGWQISQLPEDINEAEQTIKASKGTQQAVVIIEKGEGDDPNEIEILVDIPAVNL